MSPKKPKPPLRSPTRWYSSKNDTSSDVEDRLFDLDLNLAGASTPLNSQLNANSTIFSPMKRLDNLHLEGADDTVKNSDSEDDLANVTIPNDLSDVEYADGLQSEPPTFITRKRKRMVSDLPMEVITPHSKTPDVQDSGLKDMSDISYSLHSYSKLSFSNSDSTPCPVQPRKRLRFKANSQESTPSQPSKVKSVLNIAHSVKTTASPSLIVKLPGYDEDESYASVATPQLMSLAPPESTPISQLTPANLRAPSPPCEEYGDSIEGFRFVKPSGIRLASLLSKSQHLKAQLNSNQYQVVGEFPVTAAGLMDESDEDVHIADKRINDPYMHTPERPQHDRRAEIRLQYLDSTILPLMRMFSGSTPSADILVSLINDGHSVLEFYEYITADSALDAHAKTIEFIRKDRVRWHPDKWVGRHDAIHTDKVINSLIVVLNHIVQSH